MTTDPVDRLLSRLAGVRRSGAGWTARCPAHDDRRASLSVGRGDDGRALLYCHAGCAPEAVAAAIGLDIADLFADADAPAHVNGNGTARPRIVATYDYRDERGEMLYQVVRLHPKDFRIRRPDGRGGWTWGLGGTRRVLYRLPDILSRQPPARTVYIVEGEKDADALAHAGLVATTAPGGAGKWRAEYCDALRGANVCIIPDHDEPGRRHARDVARALHGVAAEVRILDLATLPPGVPVKGDVSDWLERGGTIELLDVAAYEAPMWTPETDATIFSALATAESPTTAETDGGAAGVSLDDFYAYLPEHKYIFVPARELWPAVSVNARVPPIEENGKEVKPSAWLDQYRAVEQMTWAPGAPMVVQDRLVSHGGWIERPGCATFNLYRPPTIDHGDASKAGPWLEHVYRVYPDDAEHLLRWLAHRVQRPSEKINHALVLGGKQGIGKDTILEPVKHAVGPWNFSDISPAHLLGRFNAFAKSVILRISEARDLGEVDRYSFYDHLKVYTAAPPDVLRVDEKNIREYSVFNVCGVIITTNHKTDGIYLPADDRRHYVAWSERTQEDFTPEYWTRLYRWYGEGGNRHVAAYLAALDISSFDAKAPPPKTAAFWAVVDANRAPEDGELADALDRLGWPDAVTLAEVIEVAGADFADWLRDRRNARRVPHRMEAAGYEAVRNDAAADGRWKVAGKNQVIYVRRELSVRDRIAAAQRLAEARRWSV